MGVQPLRRGDRLRSGAHVDVAGGHVPRIGGASNRKAGSQGAGAAIYSPLAGGFLNDNAVAGGLPHPMAGGTRSQEARETGLRQAKSMSFLSRKLNPDSQTEDHDLAEAAIRFVLSLEGVTTVLGGFSDREQVEQIAACSGRGPLSEDNMARLEKVWRANFGL